jgi:hypothetical protein
MRAPTLILALAVALAVPAVAWDRGKPSRP